MAGRLKHRPVFYFCAILSATMSAWQFKLLYDGECPMCRREANWLRRRSRDGRLVFEDISAPDFDASRYGLTQTQVLGVMHGVFPDGRVVTKVEAFRQASAGCSRRRAGRSCEILPIGATNGLRGTALPLAAGSVRSVATVTVASR